MIKNSTHKLALQKTILSVINALSEESGMVRIEDFYDYLKEEHKIDRVTAGKMVVQLFKERKVYSPEYHYLKTCGG